jgi:hypothetical protein
MLMIAQPRKTETTTMREISPQLYSAVLGKSYIWEKGCPACGSTQTRITPGTRIHAFGLRCCNCDKHCGWLNQQRVRVLMMALRCGKL